MAVVIPHTFGGRSGNVSPTELDDDFNALAAAIGSGVTPLAVSPTASPSANRAAIQAAIDALPAAGGILWQTVYGVHIDAELTVTKPILYLGPGTTEVSTPGVFGLYLDTVNQNGFNVSGKGPFILRDLSMKGAAGSVSGACVLVNGPTGTYKGTESVLIDNCVFYEGWFHLDFQAAIFQHVTSCKFFNYARAGVRVRNVLDGDQGDSLIDGNCVFFSTAAANKFGVLYSSGGGLKIVNCKILGNSSGIAVDPETTATDPDTISDLVIGPGVSIEGFLNQAILLTRTAGALVPAQVQLIGVQINPTSGGGTVGVSIAPAAGTAYDRIVIADCINVAPIAYQLRGVTNVTIDGGEVSAATVVLDVDATVVNLKWGDVKILAMGAFVAGAAGAGFLTSPSTQLTVAQLPASVSTGAQAFATDAKRPGEGGYVAGDAVAAGGTGAPVYFSNASWRA